MSSNDLQNYGTRNAKKYKDDKTPLHYYGTVDSAPLTFSPRTQHVTLSDNEGSLS